MRTNSEILDNCFPVSDPQPSLLVLNNYPGWLADMIQEHNCGLAVPPNNPQAFANALVNLADNPTLREQMGQNSRQLAEAHFSREDLAKKFVDFVLLICQTN